MCVANIIKLKYTLKHEAGKDQESENSLETKILSSGISMSVKNALNAVLGFSPEIPNQSCFPQWISLILHSVE